MTDIDYEKEYKTLSLTLRAAQCWILKHTGNMPTKQEVILNMIEMLADDPRSHQLFSDEDIITFGRMVADAKLAVEKKNANN